MDSDRDKIKTRPDWYVEAKRSMLRLDGARKKWKTDQTETGTFRMDCFKLGCAVASAIHRGVTKLGGFDLIQVDIDLNRCKPNSEVKVPAALVVALFEDQEIFDRELQKKVTMETKTELGRRLLDQIDVKVSLAPVVTFADMIKEHVTRPVFSVDAGIFDSPETQYEELKYQCGCGIFLYVALKDGERGEMSCTCGKSYYVESIAGRRATFGITETPSDESVVRRQAWLKSPEKVAKLSDRVLKEKLSTLRHMSPTLSASTQRKLDVVTREAKKRMLV